MYLERLNETLTYLNCASNVDVHVFLPFFFLSKLPVVSRGWRPCFAVARAYQWTGDRIQRQRDAHPLAGNNVTRLPVRHRHVHAPDWLDPTRSFRVSQRPHYFFLLLLILTDRQLRKRSHGEIPLDGSLSGVYTLFRSCSDR